MGNWGHWVNVSSSAEVWTNSAQSLSCPISCYRRNRLRYKPIPEVLKVSIVSEMCLTVSVHPIGRELTARTPFEQKVSKNARVIWVFLGFLFFFFLFRKDSWLVCMGVSSRFTGKILSKSKLSRYDAIKSNHLHTPEYGENRFSGTSGVKFYNISL